MLQCDGMTLAKGASVAEQQKAIIKKKNKKKQTPGVCCFELLVTVYL